MTDQPSNTDGTPLLGLGQRWDYGQSLSSWPLMKLARARELKAQLDARIGVWAASNPITLEQGPSDDRMFWRMRLKVNTMPPAQEWSLLLGDCLHNLRSALDAALWEFAHLNGQVPPKPRLLQFPVLREAKDWDKTRRERLQTIPDVVAERIKIVQPFNRPPEEVDADALLVLSDLNNQDKHRSTVSISLDPNTIHTNFTCGFGSREKSERNMPPNFTATFPEGLIDGAQVLEVTFKDPLVSHDGGFGVSFQTMVETPRGPQKYEELVSGLVSYTELVLRMLAVGPATPDEIKEAAESAAATDWRPFPIKHEGRTVRTDPDAL